MDKDNKAEENASTSHLSMSEILQDEPTTEFVALTEPRDAAQELLNQISAIGSQGKSKTFGCQCSIKSIVSEDSEASFFHTVLKALKQKPDWHIAATVRYRVQMKTGVVVQKERTVTSADAQTTQHQVIATATHEKVLETAEMQSAAPTTKAVPLKEANKDSFGDTVAGWITSASDDKPAEESVEMSAEKTTEDQRPVDTVVKTTTPKKKTIADTSASAEAALNTYYANKRAKERARRNS